jgi:thiamine-phosphate pyrophosphorylase
MAISRRSLCADGELGPWLGALSQAGVEAVQIREKELSDRKLLEVTRRAVACAKPQGLVIVNGRADVALASDADGVHLPGLGVPVEAARRLIGARRLVGVSTHSLEEVVRARDAGADYVFFGPVWSTPGKGPPQGLEALRKAAAIGVPVIALGGITIERFGAASEAGAAGAAGIRMFHELGQLHRMVEEAKECFKR